MRTEQELPRILFLFPKKVITFIYIKIENINLLQIRTILSLNIEREYKELFSILAIICLFLSNLSWEKIRTHDEMLMFMQECEKTNGLE